MYSFTRRPRIRVPAPSAHTRTRRPVKFKFQKSPLSSHQINICTRTRRKKTKTETEKNRKKQKQKEKKGKKYPRTRTRVPETDTGMKRIEYNFEKKTSTCAHRTRLPAVSVPVLPTAHRPPLSYPAHARGTVSKPLINSISEPQSNFCEGRRCDRVIH
jgi:hypothetical protein